MKKNIIYIILAIVIGILIGKYVFNEYKEETLETMSNTDNSVYLIQYGVYKDENSMKENAKELKNYFYYIEDNQYHVLIGIIKNKELKEKILYAYEIEDRIYMKKMEINNLEFLSSLTQYDKLISNTDDKELIISAQKQILSKYEEIILNNE